MTAHLKEDEAGLVARFRQSANAHEQRMMKWDYARKIVADGSKASLPRDIIESEFDALETDLSDAAAAIVRIAEEREEARRQRDFLREIIGLCAAALPNGAFIDATRASEKLISHLPGEISSVCNRLSSDSTASQAEVERLREALTEICPTQTLNLLWWQERARRALSQQPDKEGT